MSIAITTPVTRQIIQRSSAALGSIASTGTSSGIADGQHVQARFNGGTWIRIATVTTNAWSGTLSSQTAGQGSFDVRHEETPATTASVATVGIGDLFSCGGQSNMDGQGDNAQTYTNGAGLLASIYKAGAWANLTDPGATQGSFRPLLATQVMARTGVPVGFVFSSAGGTGISQWLPSDAGNLYNTLIKTPGQATHPGLFLWWQGESDAVAGTSQATYYADMTIIVAAVASDIGCKTMACLLQTMDSGFASLPNQAAIRAAKLQSVGDGGNNVTGPDLSGLTASPHVTSDAGLLSVATLWYNALFAAGYLQQASGSGISRSRMQLCM